MESRTRQFLRNHPNRRVRIQVLLQYPSETTGRPDHIIFTASFYEENGDIVNVIEGRVRNIGEHSIDDNICQARFYKRAQAMTVNSHDSANDSKVHTKSTCAKRIVGYFTSWGTQSLTVFQASKLTHLIYAFFRLHGNGRITLDDDSVRFQQTINMAKKHGVRVLFAIGGWENSQHFSSLVATTKMHDLIRSITDIIEKYNLDGVDIDWEYPVTGGAEEGVNVSFHLPNEKCTNSIRKIRGEHTCPPP